MPNDDPSPTAADWRRVASAAGIAATLALGGWWWFTEWKVMVIAVAAYLALPVEWRTRRNAMLIGWCVGFCVVVMHGIWRSLAL